MNFPKQRTLAIGTISVTLLVITGLFFTNAHNSPLDELGCHQDPPKSKYHCHTGVLKGKEFASKEDAERALAAAHAPSDSAEFAVTYQDVPNAARGLAGVGGASAEKMGLPPPPLPPTAVQNPDLLKIVSWKVKKRDKMDLDRIANVLAEVDIAVLHDLDLDEIGRGPLHRLGDILQTRIGERICRMWFRNASGGKEQIGILWRNSTVSHVESGGGIKDRCGDMAVIVPVGAKKGERVLATALFFSKTQKKMFMLGAVDFDSRANNLTSLFKPLESNSWPTIVTGDMMAASNHATLNDLRKAMNFKTVMSAKRPKKASTENFWTKNATARRAITINLHDRFKEMNAKDLDATVSDTFPILAEVALVPETEAAPSVMSVIEKKTKKAPSSNRPKIVSEVKKSEVFEEPKEDLEEEALDAEVGERREPASKSPSKKKKKKKR